MKTVSEMQRELELQGFIVGIREPRLNTDSAGKYMVAEPYDSTDLPTRNGENGPWCIVGDNLDALIVEAYDFWAT